MIERMRGWICINRSEDDRPCECKARQLNFILLANIFVLLLGLATLLLTARIHPAAGVAILLAAGAMVGLRVLLVRGKTIAAAYGVGIIFSLLLTAMIAMLGSTNTPVLADYVLLVAMAGLLLDRRGVTITFLVCLVQVTGLMLAEDFGLLPPPNTMIASSIDIGNWLTFLPILVYAAIFTYMVQSNINNAMARANSELAQRRNIEVQLERLVKERTHELAARTVELAARTDELADANDRLMAEIAERQQVEEELRHSQSTYAAFMDAAPGVVYVVHENGRLMHWNRCLVELAGLPEDNLRGLDVLDLVAEHDRARVETVMQDILQNGGSAGLEIHVTRSDGRSVGMYLTGARMTAEDGSRYLVGLSADISKRVAAEAALAQSQERLRALLNATSDPTYLMTPDGQFLAVNHAAARSFGATMEQVLSSNFFDLVPPSVAEGSRSIAEQVARTGKPVHLEEICPNTSSDTIIYPVFGENGVVEALAVYSRDMAEQKRAEEALRKSEERYALAARGANDVLWDLDLEADTLYLSPRWLALVGMRDGPTTRSSDEWLMLVHPADRESLVTRLMAHVNGQEPYFEAEFRIYTADGSMRWLHCRGLSVSDLNGRPVRAAGSMTDITVRKQIEAQLLHDAFHDAATGLPNRALLTERLEQAILGQRRSLDSRFAVLYMDLDRFKDVNDSLGHSAGDALLSAVARRVQASLRESDTLARLGGDEFVILLPQVKQPEDALVVAERIYLSMGLPFQLGASQIITSASMGIVLGDPSYERAEEVLRDADIAMYRAKAEGRARYAVFDSSMRRQLISRLHMETELRLALETNALEIHYQPIIALRSGACSGFEALVRWRHPERGLIMPSEFIPLAEESLMILAIDRYVLREACRQVQAWRNRFGPLDALCINVNLSGKHITQSDLIDHVTATLEETGLPPTCLRLEITESAIMENIDIAYQTLRRLQNLGVQVEIDDFGTGFSSLTYLFQLPVNMLKIDRSFIRQLGIDARKTEIVQTIVNLAHNIGLEVVAEGLETPDQWERMKALGCDHAQGFLFSAGMMVEGAEEYLAAERVHVFDVARALPVPAATGG